MLILSIILLIVITILLSKITRELGLLKETGDKIEKMVVMTAEEKKEYDLRTNNPDQYLDYVQGKYWENETKRNIKNKKIIELIKKQPKLTLTEIAERYGESELSLQIIINQSKRK